MTYLQASNRPSKERTKFIIIICAIVVIIFGLVQFFIPHFLPSVFTTFARPFWRIEFSVQQGSLNSPENLLNRNAELERHLELKNVELQSYQDLSDQNAELLALLGRKELTVSTTTFVIASTSSSTSTTTKVKPIAQTKFQKTNNVSQRVLAAVLIRPPYANYDELIIDIGNDHGLVVGNNVYTNSNVLIGKVSDVLKDTSKVLLYSSSGQTFPVLIGSSRIQANAVGRGGGQYSAQIPQAVVVNAGDLVSDSTISDLPFGIVKSVLANPAEPYQTVLFAPPVNVFQLRWVEVEVK